VGSFPSWCDKPTMFPGLPDDAQTHPLLAISDSR
jgi:hypothetical protein